MPRFDSVGSLINAMRGHVDPTRFERDPLEDRGTHRFHPFESFTSLDLCLRCECGFETMVVGHDVVREGGDHNSIVAGTLRRNLSSMEGRRKLADIILGIAFPQPSPEVIRELPEYPFGPTPVRTELTILPADEPRQLTVGFRMTETLGTHNRAHRVTAVSMGASVPYETCPACISASTLCEEHGASRYDRDEPV